MGERRYWDGCFGKSQHSVGVEGSKHYNTVRRLHFGSTKVCTMRILSYGSSMFVCLLRPVYRSSEQKAIDIIWVSILRATHANSIIEKPLLCPASP